MIIILIFASNINAMTDSIVDNNRNVPITPLSEFVDSVFAELSSHSNEWNEYLEGYGYFDNPDCWKNTLIPLAIRLYELAQTDDMVYWWLLQLMSSIDVCKDGELDLRKRKVFEILSKLDPKHSSLILGKSVPEHYNELHEALRTNALDVFRNYLTIEEENSILYNIYRVLKRIEDIRNIYEETMSYSKGDALGKLFLLFKRYYRYFAEAYKNTQRSCDGMAKNVFLALYQTQFRHDKNDFCDVADIIGGLWERSLMLTYIKDKDQMPLSVSNIMYNVFQEGGDAEVFKSLDDGFRDRINEKRREAFVNEEGGWLEFEKYGFIWKYVLDNEWKKTLPPFSCRCLNKRRSVRRPVQRNGNMERSNVQDNCVPYLDSKNAIPMEELKAVATSEDVLSKQGIPEQPSELKPLPIPGQIKLFKDDDCVGEFEAIPLSFENKDAFLRELAVVLFNYSFISWEEQENFIHAFDGTTASSESHSKINWKESAASLFALCYVLFDEEITGKWPIIANLFVVKGKSLDTSNASKFKTGTNRRKMQKHVKEALENIGVA